jgi:hypothetical protein
MACIRKLVCHVSYTNNVFVTCFKRCLTIFYIHLFTKTLIHIVLIKVDLSGTCCYIHVGNNIKASDFTRNIVSLTNLTKASTRPFLATRRYFPQMSHK